MKSEQAIRYYMEQLYKACYIPIQYIKDGEWKFGFGLYAEHSIEGILNLYLCDKCLLQELLENPSDIYYVREEKNNSNIIYGVFYVDSSWTVILGPVSIFPLTHIEIRDYLRQHGITSGRDFSIQCSSQEQIRSILTLLALLISVNEKIPITEKIYDAEQSPTVPFYQLLQYQLDNYEDSPQHFPYSIEERLHSYVEKGDYEALMKMMDEAPLAG